MKSTKNLVYQSSTPANEFLQRLDSARKVGLFCDGSIVAQEKTIKVHRVILAASSPFFMSLFELSETEEVECLDLPAEDLDYIINFLYTGQFSVPYTKVKDVLSACQKCEIEELSEACISFLADHFHNEDAFELRNFAAVNGHFQLCNKIDAYLKKSLHSVYQSKEFLLLPRLQVSLIASQSCSNHELENISSIFERVISWVQKRQQEYGEKLNSLLEENNMLYLQSNHLLKDCALEEIEEQVDFNSNEDIKKFKRQTSRGRTELYESYNMAPKRKMSYQGTEYKLIVDMQTSDQNALGLAIVADQVLVIALHYKTKQCSSNASSVSSDSSGCEDNFLNNSVTMLAPMTTGRCSAGIATHDKKLFVIGGYNRGCCLESCEVYDPEVNEWADLPPLGVKRARLQSVAVGEKIYVVGGSNGHEDLSSIEVYDPANKTWEPGNEMIDRRASFGMDCLGGKVYVAGGVSDSKSMRKAECFDVESKKWTRLPPMKASRENVCVVAYNNKIYSIGGSDGWRCHNSVEVYNPEDDDWSDKSSMSGPRRGAACAVYDGRIIVAGGTDGKTALKTVECYDELKDTWAQMPSMTSCRNNASMVVLDSILYVIGGFGGYSGTEFLNTVEYFDNVANEWKVYIHG